jgi:tRNA(Ser,Leu) C12 N-acetylase TAN1
MVWVDDLLLFASLRKIMKETKTFLQSEWEVTDLEEPNKIIGIEITQKPDSITISQQAYIESILCWENLHEMHGTQSPMDPNIKFIRNPDE